MIFTTGDTHGTIDYAKLVWFASEMRNLTKKDYMIIAGDFGAIWSKKYLEEDLDRYSTLRGRRCLWTATTRISI